MLQPLEPLKRPGKARGRVQYASRMWCLASGVMRRCKRCRNWLCNRCWARHSSELCLGGGRQCVVCAFYLGSSDTRKCDGCNGLAQYQNDTLMTNIVCCRCCMRHYCRRCWPAHDDAQCSACCNSSLPASLDSMTRYESPMYFPHGPSMASGPDDWYPWCGVCSKPIGQSSKPIGQSTACDVVGVCMSFALIVGLDMRAVLAIKGPHQAYLLVSMLSPTSQSQVRLVLPPLRHRLCRQTKVVVVLAPQAH